MTKPVNFASKTGAALEGAFAEPAGSAKVGGLVVVQEWWGLNDQMKSLCDRFAQEGFLALAPDLFHGLRPSSQEQAAQAMATLDKSKAVSEIGDAAAWIKTLPRSSGKVGVVGFCLGGGLTFAAARYVDGIGAAVPFYGLAEVPSDEFARVRVPIQAHFSKTDGWAKVSVAQDIQARVRSGGGHMDLYVYDAGHAFMRSTDPSVYDPVSAKIAWQRAIDFLKARLV